MASSSTRVANCVSTAHSPRVKPSLSGSSAPSTLRALMPDSSSKTGMALLMAPTVRVPTFRPPAISRASTWWSSLVPPSLRPSRALSDPPGINASLRSERLHLEVARLGVGGKAEAPGKVARPQLPELAVDDGLALVRHIELVAAAVGEEAAGVVDDDIDGRTVDQIFAAGMLAVERIHGVVGRLVPAVGGQHADGEAVVLVERALLHRRTQRQRELVAIAGELAEGDVDDLGAAHGRID